MPELKWNADLYNQQHNFVYEHGENVLEWLDPQEGEKILDVGCGTGELTNKIHEAGAIVTAIDSSQEMIEKARDKYDDIKFFISDAGSFSFNEKFDAVFSNAVLHWINKQQEALQCIYHVLKNGGRFVFEMGGRHNVESIHNAIRKAMKEEGVEDKIPVDLNYFPSVAEQCSLLEKVGFTVSDVMYFKRPTRLEGEDGMRLWIDQFCSFFFKNISNELKEKITTRAVRELRKTNYRNGEWNADYVRLRVKAIKE
ncbi:MAG: class I SAM-dependent methyltransferase [Chitinophagales bacterium]